MNQPLIKWTGSKRPIAKAIISHFPKHINTYFEPFVGGGSVFLELLKSGHDVDKFVISDINKPLVGIYQLVKDNPKELIDSYSRMWQNLKDGSEYYYETRKEFNKDYDPCKFFFLTRTCYNGTIRFNGKGEFNVGHHFGRDGMNPKTIEEIVMFYHNLMQGKDITILNGSYISVVGQCVGDVTYLDPPYSNNKSLYFGNVDNVELCNYINNLKGSWFVNMNGINESDNDAGLNIDYDQKILLKSGKSSFSRLKNKDVEVREYFYLKNV